MGNDNVHELVTEFIEEQVYPLANQLAYDMFGNNFIPKDGFWIDRYCELSNWLEDPDSQDQGGETIQLDLTVLARHGTKYCEKDVYDFVNAIIDDFFRHYRCGCSYDCCGHKFTANVDIRHKVIKNWSSPLTSADGIGADAYDFHIRIHNGYNY